MLEGAVVERGKDRGLQAHAGWVQLRQLWWAVPEPEWDRETSDRVFRNIVREVERRRRRRRLLTRSAWVLLPVVMFVTACALRV